MNMDILMWDGGGSYGCLLPCLEEMRLTKEAKQKRGKRKDLNYETIIDYPML